MKEILFNVPNCIGYLRIALILVASNQTDTYTRLIFIVLAVVLDLLDGIAARQLHQETAFGAWLDVTIDLFTRGYLWSLVIPEYAFLIFGFEFAVFVSTHSLGNSWQNKTKTLKLNWLAEWTISKGFKTLPGFIAITGLWVLPLWCYAIRFSILDQYCGTNIPVTFCRKVEWKVFWVLLIFRMFCAYVEGSVLLNHIKVLLNNDKRKVK